MSFGSRGGAGRGAFGVVGARGAFRNRRDEPSPVPRERRGRTLRRIAAFFRPYRPQIGVVVAAILVTSLLGLINPLLLGKLIDEVIVGHHYERLNLYVGLMIVIPIATGLLGVGQAYLNNIVGQNVMQDLRNALYTHLQRQPLRFFTETRTGEIQSRLANDVGGVQQVVTDTAANLTSNVAVALSTMVAMFLIDWRLTAMSLGVLPFFMYLTFRVGKVRREVSSETQKSLADLSAATEETLSVSGMLLTKTFGQQGAAIERFRGLNLRLARLQIRQAMVGRWFFMIIGTIFSITPAFVYWLAGTLAANGDKGAPTAGAIVAFTTLQSRLFFPLGALLNVQVEIQGSLALFDRIFEYLDLDPEIVDAPDAVALDAATLTGRVRLRDVSFHYPSSAVPVVADPGSVDGAGADDLTPAAAGLADTEQISIAPPDVPPLVVPELRLIQGFALEAIDFEAAPGRAGRAGRAVRIGQDHDHLPDPAAVRRRRRLGRGGRPRRAQDHPRVARPGRSAS